MQERTVRFGMAMAIYRIEMERRDPVFMRVDRSDFCNDERSVAIFNSSRFLRAWRAASNPVWRGPIYAAVDPIIRAWNRRSHTPPRWLPWLSRKAWMRDYRFQKAMDGFALSTENPVPLAMECAAPIAETLSRTVGVEWAYPQTVQELLGPAGSISNRACPGPYRESQPE